MQKSKNIMKIETNLFSPTLEKLKIDSRTNDVLKLKELLETQRCIIERQQSEIRFHSRSAAFYMKLYQGLLSTFSLQCDTVNNLVKMLYTDTIPDKENHDLHSV